MTHTTEPTIEEILIKYAVFTAESMTTPEFIYQSDRHLTTTEATQAIQALISDQVAKARYDIAEEMGKMMEIQGVNGTWNYDSYMHGMYNGMEFCHALVKGVEPKYREAPKKWLADIPMPKNAKATQTYPKRSKE